MLAGAATNVIPTPSPIPFPGPKSQRAPTAPWGPVAQVATWCPQPCHPSPSLPSLPHFTSVTSIPTALIPTQKHLLPAIHHRGRVKLDEITALALRAILYLEQPGGTRTFRAAPLHLPPPVILQAATCCLCWSPGAAAVHSGTLEDRKMNP